MSQGRHGEVHEAQSVAGIHLQGDKDSGHGVDVLVGALGKEAQSVRESWRTREGLGHSGLQPCEILALWQ